MSKQKLKGSNGTAMQSTQVEQLTRNPFQKFEAQEIARSQIKNAPYNPRKIDDHARRKLKKKIKQVGLIETLIWNRQTGHLVGGHQRLSILDELSKAQDYLLTVSVIDVDEKTEKQLNIFLNNPSAQGEYDLTKLEDLLKEMGGDFSELGFDNLDLQVMLDSEQFAPLFSEDNEKAKPTIEQIAKIKQTKREHREKGKLEDDAEFYFITVFPSRAHLDRFLEKCQLPVEQRYVDGIKLAHRLGFELSNEKEA